MNCWEKSPQEIEKLLGTSIKKGLSTETAQKRLQEQGKNTLHYEGNKKGIFYRFLEQLNDFMVIVLISASVVSFAVSYINGEKDFVDSAIILLIVGVNAVLGMVQQSRAEKALEALKKLSAPKAKVLREGVVKEIEGEDVVVGDILVLEAGDYVCADGRLIETESLKAEESAITGESVAVEKNANVICKEHTLLGDRSNMVLCSSYITYGRGKAIVTATALETEVGHIAKMIAEEKESQTPLQKKLGQTGKILGIGALVICLVIFCMGLLTKADPFEMFMTSVSLAVAAIPEGLPAIVTIVLAIGMQKMSKKNTIIRRLPAVETLGGASVICSDKTGTLTQNKMKVVKVSDFRTEQQGEYNINVLSLACLCNDCRKEGSVIIGEPTESALAEALEQLGENFVRLKKKYKRVGEIPFSSERKLMTTVHKMEDGSFLSVTKGASDILLDKCSYCIEHGTVVTFSNTKKGQAKKMNGQLAEQALRVIAVACKKWDKKPNVSEQKKLERDLTFVGMVGMIDPPRPEAKKAVEVCKKAGIKAVMITGDHVLTAKAIAKELGIYEKNDKCMTGEELQKISDEALSEQINQYSVFARVSPEHKVRIVKAFQSQGNVVAMTGDGVNDAPALKTADIGCAMGKNGTEVAKGAADMILTDDNFATIVEAVKQGRGIYDNIKKAVHFLLSSNIGEIITIFVAMCFGWSTPLLPIQLLWVNLVTDSLPAIALGLDPSDKDIMERKPESSKKSMFSDGMGVRIALEGCMIGMLALLAFAVGHVYFDEAEQHIIGRTMAFAVLSISQLVHAFNMRTEHSIFTISIFSNIYLVGAFLIGTILQAGVIMVPALSTIFKVKQLEPIQWGIVALLVFIPIIVVELEKWKDRISIKNQKQID